MQGRVDINTLAEDQAACFDGAKSRHASGPMKSNVAGGWSYDGMTGIAVVSTTQMHTPFWTGLRSYDLPGRCSVFTIAPATIHVNYLCGSGLPYTVKVGVFTDTTRDDVINADDIYFWRRMQFPRADVLYRSTLPYKLQLDVTAYTQDSTYTRITFDEAQDYIKNLSVVIDGYPQTPILVGWQGLGHDTLYPGWDLVNERLGGQQGLFNLAGNLTELSRSKFSSLSYHVNSDEAYSMYNGTANPEFDIGICRLQVDHLTAWYSNCTVTHEQNPDCGIRCR